MMHKSINSDYRPELDPDALLNPHEAAKMLSTTAGVLAVWRSKGIGPAYLKQTPGEKGRARYRRRDVLAYIASMERIEPVSQVA